MNTTTRTIRKHYAGDNQSHDYAAVTLPAIPGASKEKDLSNGMIVSIRPDLHLPEGCVVELIPSSGPLSDLSSEESDALMLRLTTVVRNWSLTIQGHPCLFSFLSTDELGLEEGEVETSLGFLTVTCKGLVVGFHQALQVLQQRQVRALPFRQLVLLRRFGLLN